MRSVLTIFGIQLHTVKEGPFIFKFQSELTGKFAVIMADPPWDIHMELPYGTMSDDEMRQLGIPTLQDDGLIFLWVTGRYSVIHITCQLVNNMWLHPLSHLPVLLNPLILDQCLWKYCFILVSTPSWVNSTLYL